MNNTEPRSDQTVATIALESPTRSAWPRLAAFVTLAAIYFSPVTAQTFQSIKQIIRKRFPSVRQISAQALADWLADTNRPAPVLVDVRNADEFAVSHLRNARHCQSVSEVENAVGNRDKPIIVYCSVGYRSSALAAKLQKARLTNVFNLEGAIFGWANEGRPVFRGTNAVSFVHPYNAKWGKLLDARYHPANLRR